MSRGSNVSSSVVESGSSHARPSDPQLKFGLAVAKYVLIIVVLLGPYVSVFLRYLNPALASLCLVLGLVCWIPLFFVSLAALLRRRWKALGVLSATWLFAFLPFLGVN